MHARGSPCNACGETRCMHAPLRSVGVEGGAAWLSALGCEFAFSCRRTMRMYMYNLLARSIRVLAAVCETMPPTPTAV